MLASSQIPYLIGERKPVTLTTRTANVVTADAVIESVALSAQGRRLAFWCESLPGPVGSCFAQSFSAEGAPESGVVPVFDLPPADQERIFSRWGAAIWTSEDEALLLIGCRRARAGNQLLVQRWNRGRVTEPAQVSNAFELGTWGTLVRTTSGEIDAVWREEARSFSFSTRRITVEGTPEGAPVRLEKVWELALPRAVAAAGTRNGISLAWSEMHNHHPTVYVAQFDRNGKRTGEPLIVFDDLAVDDPLLVIGRNEQVVVAATTPEHDVLLRAVGGPLITVTRSAEPGSLRLAKNTSDEIAVAWRTRYSDVQLRTYTPTLEPLTETTDVATGIEKPFLSLGSRGTSWLLHFRKVPEDAKLHYLWLTYAP